MLENQLHAGRTLLHWFELLEPGSKIHVIVPDIEFHAKQLRGLEKRKFTDQLQRAYAGFAGGEWNLEVAVKRILTDGGAR